jgi:hypothetical protein
MNEEADFLMRGDPVENEPSGGQDTRCRVHGDRSRVRAPSNSGVLSPQPQKRL